MYYQDYLKVADFWQRYQQYYLPYDDLFRLEVPTITSYDGERCVLVNTEQCNPKIIRLCDVQLGLVVDQAKKCVVRAMLINSNQQIEFMTYEQVKFQINKYDKFVSDSQIEIIGIDQLVENVKQIIYLVDNQC